MSQVSVGTSATLLASVPDGPRAFFFQNLGTDDVFWGLHPNVSSSDGAKLKPDDAISLEAKFSVYAIAASGTQTVAVIDV